MKKILKTLTLALVLTLIMSSTGFAGIPIKKPGFMPAKCKGCKKFTHDCLTIRPFHEEVLGIGQKPEIYRLDCSDETKQKYGYWIAECSRSGMFTVTHGTIGDASKTMIANPGIIKTHPVITEPVRY